MIILIGKTFSQYEIIAQIGQGGMGAVYRARDTNLDRDVALKVITVAMSGDAERIARFQREAKTLASLQHPNIAAVHGYEDVDGVRFLVMELVEGSDLATQLQGGPLPEEEAVEIIRHVAAGLNEAHRNGIVHRDLKPANVMLTPDGTVKILDFGLASTLTTESDSISDPGLSPTITAAMTQAGTILGTAAYMAPEQARGKKVDQRADIWAMGTILYELLTGHRLFVGETTTDVLASVIKIAPDLDALPKSTSPQVRRMLQRCLQRDPRKRLHSAADALLELDEEVAAGEEPTGSRRPFLPWAVAAVLGLALAFVLLRPTVGTREIVRRHYDLDLPGYAESVRAYRPVVSPDGRYVAISLTDSLRTARIMLRSLETGAQSFVENSVGGEYLFWSPDSRFLGFVQAGRMRKLHVESGTVQVVTSAVKTGFRGGAWSADGKIIYAPGSNDGLLLIDADGGETETVTVVDSTMVDGSHRWPCFLPDGQRFVFTLWSNMLEERSEQGGIFLGSLDGAPPRRLLRDVSGAVISRAGYLFFHRNGRLMAVDFDFESGQVRGEPRLVAEEVAFLDFNGRIGMSVDDRGDIFLSVHNPDAGLRLGWLGRDGQWIDGFGEDLPLALGLDLARDERHYAAEILNEEGSVQIWIGDVERGSFSRLSRFDSDCWGAVFSPNGREVIYGVQVFSGGVLYRHGISGAKAPEAIVEFDNYESYVTARNWFAPDQVLVEHTDPQTKATGIFLLDLQQKEMTPVLMDDFDQQSPQISPDGRWLAYVSTESGTPEIYVRNWPGLDRKWQVSRQGGGAPHWSHDGAELAFGSITRLGIRVVDFLVENDEPRISLPRTITPLGQNIRLTTYTADHQRYLVGFSTADPELPPVKVLVGWGGNPQ